MSASTAIKKWEDRATEAGHFEVIRPSQSVGHMLAEIAELRAALEAAEAELEEWRFTNRIDELQRENDRLRAAQPDSGRDAARCEHQNKDVGWEEVTCLDCGWVKPSDEIRGPHRGWFPSVDAVRAWDKYKTYPGMQEHIAAQQDEARPLPGDKP